MCSTRGAVASRPDAEPRWERCGANISLPPHRAARLIDASGHGPRELVLVETLRIAIVTENLPPARLNLQPWRYLGELAKSIQRAGHETIVLTSEGRMPDWNGVRVVHHPDRGAFQSAGALRGLLGAHQVDAGISRLTAGLFFSMRGGRLPAPTNARLVGIFLRPLHSGRNLARRFLDPALAREIPSDRHHAAMYVSRFLGTWSGASAFVDGFAFLWESDRDCGVSAGIPSASCHVVRHPFDPFFLQHGRRDVGPRLSDTLRPVERRVVFSGPPEESRGVSDVIRLARVLAADHPTQVVLLLRDPKFRWPTIERRPAGAHELVFVRGLLSREEIRGVYHQSHAAVFPYRFVRTGLPLVALEAIAADLPVVTTRVHPIRELEGATGLTFARPRDPRDLARAVQDVFVDVSREDIRKKNEAWIQTSPSWNTVAKTFVSICGG